MSRQITSSILMIRPAGFSMNTETAVNNYKNAIYYHPLNGEYLQRFGLILSWMDNSQAAEQLLKSGIENEIINLLWSDRRTLRRRTAPA